MIVTCPQGSNGSTNGGVDNQIVIDALVNEEEVECIVEGDHFRLDGNGVYRTR